MAGRDAGGRFTSGNVFGQGHLGYAVGNLEWLEGAESKVGRYFRSIEYGTHGFVGKKLAGLWGPGTRLAPSGALVPFGEGSLQQFFPLGPSTGDPRLATGRAALAYLREQGFEGRQGGRPKGTAGVVKHEIVAMGAYEKAAANFEPVEREKLAIAQAFKDSGLESAMAASGRKPRGRSNSSGAVGANFTTRMEGRGFIKAGAISTRSRSYAQIDKAFQANLTEANRLLAEALAAEVALVIQDKIKRKETSKGWLEDATLSAKNRFPA